MDLLALGLRAGEALGSPMLGLGDSMHFGQKFWRGKTRSWFGFHRYHLYRVG